MAFKMIGEKYGRLTVIEQDGVYNRNGEKVWKCKCDCGNFTSQRGSFLRNFALKKDNGYAKGIFSCGCGRKEMEAERLRTHGLTFAGADTNHEYRIWRNIMYRCYNPECSVYKWYGGKGVKVCKRWQNPVNFVKDMGKRPDGLDLILIDKNKDYSKKNCKWATHRDAMQNTRRVKLNVIAAKEIRELYKSGEYTLDAIGDMYEVSDSSIFDIVHNKHWKE